MEQGIKEQLCISYYQRPTTRHIGEDTTMDGIKGLKEAIKV